MSIRKMPPIQINLFSEVVIDLIKKKEANNKYGLKNELLTKQKEVLLDEFLNIQKLHSFEEKMKAELLYAQRMDKNRLDFLENEKNEKKRLFELERLDIIFNLLTRNDINEDDLYGQLLEKIKDEIVFNSEIKLKLCREKLLKNQRDQDLSPNEKIMLDNEKYLLKENLDSIKRVLKLNKLSEIKSLNIRDLLIDDIEITFEKMFPEAFKNSNLKCI